jgi:hypothetical protein
MRRLESDDALERISLIADETYIPWLENLSVVVIYLAGIYIWLYAILWRRPFWETIGLTITAILIFISLTQFVRPFLGKVGSTFGFYGTSDCYHGTITFTISLAKIHYEVPILLLIGVILELGVFSMMLHQIVKVVSERRAATN